MAEPCSDDIGVVPPQSTSAGGSSSCAPGELYDGLRLEAEVPRLREFHDLGQTPLPDGDDL